MRLASAVCSVVAQEGMAESLGTRPHLVYFKEFCPMEGYLEALRLTGFMILINNFVAAKEFPCVFLSIAEMLGLDVGAAGSVSNAAYI